MAIKDIRGKCFMMRQEEIQTIMNQLMEFLPAESRYKELYAACPEVFNMPIYNWEEFRNRLQESDFDIEIPHEAPSPILPWLSEDEWFPEKRLDVSIVMNDRYCPPFWHRLEFIKIVYVASGSADLFVGDRKIKITEGNLCIVPPGVENATFSYNDDDIVINIIIKRSTFEKSFASLLMESSRLSDFFWRMLYKKNENKVILFKKSNDSDLTEQVLQLYRELNLESSPSNIMLKSYLMLFFGHMLRHYERDDGDSDREQEKDSHLTDILRYMSDHKETVTLPELAARFCFSEGYLSRYLRQKTGEPFNVLLKEMRIEQAAVMLQNFDFSIEEVCCAVGYSDISRFYRNFKEHYGMTPAQFRQINII